MIALASIGAPPATAARRTDDAALDSTTGTATDNAASNSISLTTAPAPQPTTGTAATAANDSTRLTTTARPESTPGAAVPDSTAAPRSAIRDSVSSFRLAPPIVRAAGNGESLGRNGAHTSRRFASATVPVQDPVYQDLDRLDALGLLPEEVTFHRPLSRAEIARIVEKASRRPEAVHPPARDLLVRLRREYPVRPLGEDEGLEMIELGGAATNSSPEKILRNNGIGQIDGSMRPLTGYREGDAFADGGTFWFESRHAYHLGSHLAFGIRTDLRSLLANETSYPFAGGGDGTASGLDLKTEGHFKALYGRFMIGRFIFQVGRDALLLAPAPVGGILLSNNARPLDMFLFTNESSYRLPWIFRYMGPQRISFAVADLGAHRVFPHSFLLVTLGTFRPVPRIELGIWDTLVMGGEGAPKPAFLEILHEIFPYGRKGEDEDLSDHRLAFDVRLHVVPRRLLFYHEAFLDDGFRPAPLGDMMDVMSFRSGLYAPALGPHGAIDARFEVTRIPAITYRHGRWTTGYTLDGHLLGDELGPDSRGVRLSGRWNRRDGNSVSAELAYEGRDADIWAQKPTDDPNRFGDIYRLHDHPTESRYRVRTGLDWRVSPAATWHPRLAVERVINRDFTADHNATEFLAELGIQVRFGATTADRR